MNVGRFETDDGDMETVYYTPPGSFGDGSATDPFFYLEFSMSCLLLVDYLLRLSTADDKLAFVFSFYSVIDVAAFFSIAYWGIFVDQLKVRGSCS